MSDGLKAGYRADGLRAWKSVGGVRTYCLYDENGDPCFEMDASGKVKAENVFAPTASWPRRRFCEHP